jgi:hypothetical protein
MAAGVYTMMQKKIADIENTAVHTDVCVEWVGVWW